jgi:predicted transcriptional regulator
MSLLGESKTEILFYIERSEEPYGYGISDSLGISLPAVYEHLNDLESYGILRSHTGMDRRVYELTETGMKLVEVLHSVSD